jgi:phosphoribosylformimino-5-aminoimidazole carboxamide ribotide isomerase
VILYPAIDLKDGRCVRLVRGEMSRATIFNDDPPAQAQSFAAAGARWLHVVDLDGALAGTSRNASAVDAILRATTLSVQLGGGIRSDSAIASWLERGAARVVLGTVALTDPALVKAACRAWPGRVALAIDARAGRVAVEGWARTSDFTALDLALAFEDAGAAAIVHTDIDRDGVLEGAAVEATAAIARRLKTPVIASGGISSETDIAALRAYEKDGISGAIIGRALYDGRIDLKHALQVAEAPC